MGGWAWIDEEFDAVAIDARRNVVPRLIIMVAFGLICAGNIGWRVASLWLTAGLVSTLWLFLANRSEAPSLGSASRRLNRLAQVVAESAVMTALAVIYWLAADTDLRLLTYGILATLLVVALTYSFKSLVMTAASGTLPALSFIFLPWLSGDFSAFKLGTLMICAALAVTYLSYEARRNAANGKALRQARAEATAKGAAIHNLLDNADQGFLTIGPDLRVGGQFSAACEAILGGTPTDLSIVELLFGTLAGEAASNLRTTLESVFRDSSDLARELKLELLPQQFELGGKTVRAGYKFLADSGRLMIILTDVTETRRLTLEIGRERKRLEMIVLAVTEADAFAALANDYQRFLDEELPQAILRFDDPTMPEEFYRRLHTFKGLLAQFSFTQSPAAVHEMEDRLAARETWTAQAALAAFAAGPLLAAFDRDMAAVSEVLGPDFAKAGRRLVLSQDQLQAMEKLARQVLASDDGPALSPPLRLLLQTLADLGLMDVKAALALHSRSATTLAGRLDKQLAPIIVEGDDVALPPERYAEFFRSLVHLFRNAVDHGMEAPEERELAGKAAEGTIRCDVRERGDGIDILIADDGRGIDRHGLEDRLAASGVRGAEALSLEALVFRQGLSSRDVANDVSGRGVGLAAVKAELDRLGGSVSVTSAPGQGAQFCFHLPTGQDGRAVDLQRAV